MDDAKSAATSNHAVLTKMYSDYSAGNLQGLLDACDDKITFQVAGKSRVAGKFTKANFAADFAEKLGQHRLEVHDILASDRHGVVLASDYFTREGKETQVRTVHVWRFENGKPVAWYEYPRDLYQFDALLG